MSNTNATQSPAERCFEYQLEILGKEIEYLDRIIGRMDTITQATKNWAIVTWTASVGFALGSEQLRPFGGATAVLPLIFWLIDGTWRRLQKRSVYRTRKISEFLNEGGLAASLKQGKLVNFHVFDLVGSGHAGDEEFKDYVSLKKTLFFREVFLIYWALAAISLALDLIVAFNQL